MHSCGQDNASRFQRCRTVQDCTFDPASDEPRLSAFREDQAAIPALCSRKVTTTLSLSHGPPRDHADRGRALDLAKINPLARTHLGKVVRFSRIAFEPADVAERGRPSGRPRRLSAHVAAEPAYKLPMCARCSFGAFGKVLGQDRRDGRHGVLQFATTRYAASRFLLHGPANDAHLFPCFRPGDLGLGVARAVSKNRIGFSRCRSGFEEGSMPWRMCPRIARRAGRGHPALVSRRSSLPLVLTS